MNPGEKKFNFTCIFRNVKSIFGEVTNVHFILNVYLAAELIQRPQRYGPFLNELADIEPPLFVFMNGSLQISYQKGSSLHSEIIILGLICVDETLPYFYSSGEVESWVWTNSYPWWFSDGFEAEGRIDWAGYELVEVSCGLRKRKYIFFLISRD